MDPKDYLESLILGAEHSSIPVQPSELKLLKMFLDMYGWDKTGIGGQQ